MYQVCETFLLRGWSNNQAVFLCWYHWYLSLSLSLSLTHTHTHIYVQMVYSCVCVLPDYLCTLCHTHATVAFVYLYRWQLYLKKKTVPSGHYWMTTLQGLRLWQWWTPLSPPKETWWWNICPYLSTSCSKIFVIFQVLQENVVASLLFFMISGGIFECEALGCALLRLYVN
jgi:hypothetical protein